MDDARWRLRGALFGLVIGVALVFAGATAASSIPSMAGVVGFFVLLGAMFAPLVTEASIEL